MTRESLTVRIGEIGRIVTGKTPPTADSENYGGTLLFITPSDMKGHKYIDHTERTIIRHMPQRNLALEVLKKLLNDEINNSSPSVKIS